MTFYGLGQILVVVWEKSVDRSSEEISPIETFISCFTSGKMLI